MKQLLIYISFILVTFWITVPFVSCSSEETKDSTKTLSQEIAANIKEKPDDWVKIKSDFKMVVDSSCKFVKIAAENEKGIIYFQNNKCGICIEEGLWGIIVTTKNGSVELNMNGRNDIVNAIYEWEDQKRIKAENKILEGICK